MQLNSQGKGFLIVVCSAQEKTACSLKNWVTAPFFTNLVDIL